MSIQQGGIESWQCSPSPVERGPFMLDVPGPCKYLLTLDMDGWEVSAFAEPLKVTPEEVMLVAKMTEVSVIIHYGWMHGSGGSRLATWENCKQADQRLSSVTS